MTTLQPKELDPEHSSPSKGRISTGIKIASLILLGSVAVFVVGASLIWAFNSIGRGGVESVSLGDGDYNVRYATVTDDGNVFMLVRPSTENPVDDMNGYRFCKLRNDFKVHGKSCTDCMLRVYGEEDGRTVYTLYLASDFPEDPL